MDRRLSDSTIKRVLDDKELAEILDKKVKAAGVHTSIGYSAVLQQFLASDVVTSKLKEWEDAKDNYTASTAATSKMGGTANSFATKLALYDETVDPYTISPLTTVSTPLHKSSRNAFSDYGTRAHVHETVSPSRTFPSLPFTSRDEGFSDSPTFRKQFVEFLGSHPKNPFNLNLKDEAIVPKKTVPRKNLQSRRRTSLKQAKIACELQSLDCSSPDLSNKDESVDDLLNQIK